MSRTRTLLILRFSKLLKRSFCFCCLRECQQRKRLTYSRLTSVSDVLLLPCDVDILILICGCYYLCYEKLDVVRHRGSQGTR